MASALHMCHSIKFKHPELPIKQNLQKMVRNFENFKIAIFEIFCPRATIHISEGNECYYWMLWVFSQ